MSEKDAIIPIIKMSEVNEKISIYSGEMTIENEEGCKIKLVGEISLDWVPQPCISFVGESLDKDASNLNLLEEEVTLTTSYGSQYIVLLTNIISGSKTKNKIAGFVIKELDREPQQINSLYFSVVNFVNFHGDSIKQNGFLYRGRMTFEYGNYIITFDKLPNYESNYKELKQNGGFIITHVGSINHRDGNSFEYEEIRDLLTGLTYLLSFARGSHVGICSIHGYLEKELKLSKYQTPLINSWKEQQNWFPRISSDRILEDLYPALIDKMRDPLWEKVLKQVFTWYFDSHTSTYTETKIISVQVALEMLAWTFLVEENEIIEEAYYVNKLRASDKIRRLLDELSIPRESLDISRFNSLNEDYDDGAHLLTDVRNKIIHPKRVTIQEDELHQSMYLVSNLGRKYLELCILKILGYEGVYQNLLNGSQWIGENLEQVPWSDQ